MKTILRVITLAMLMAVVWLALAENSNGTYTFTYGLNECTAEMSQPALGQEMSFEITSANSNEYFTYSYTIYVKYSGQEEEHTLYTHSGTAEAQLLFTPKVPGCYRISFSMKRKNGDTFAYGSVSFDVEGGTSYSDIVSALAEECISECGSDKYEQMVWMHDYLTNRAHKSGHFYSGEGIILYGKGSCNNCYADAFKTLMDALGIPCEIVLGTYNGSPVVSWNTVQIGGAWNFVDVAFDDPADGYESHGYIGVSKNILSMEKRYIVDGGTSAELCTTDSLNYYARKGFYDEWLTAAGVYDYYGNSNPAGEPMTVLDVAADYVKRLYTQFDITFPNYCFMPAGSGTEYVQAAYLMYDALTEYLKAQTISLNRSQIPFVIVDDSIYLMNYYTVSNTNGQAESAAYIQAEVLDMPSEGQCGDDISWAMDVSSFLHGELLITGSGEMDDYSRDLLGDVSVHPWDPNNSHRIELAEVSEGVTSIGSNAFAGMKWLGHTDPINQSAGYVKLPGTLASIGDGAFRGCEALETVSIPSGVVSMGSYAFAGSGIKNLTIPQNVTVISEGLFSGCSQLASVTLPAGITQIGADAFSGCSSLVSVIFEGTAAQWAEIAVSEEGNGCLLSLDISFESEDGIVADGQLSETAAWALKSDGTLSIDGTGIIKLNGSAAPWGSASVITKLVVGEGITEIGADVFKGANQMESVKFPSSLETLGVRSFKGCTSLTEIYIPLGVTKVYGDCFSECTSLMYVHLPETLTTLGESVFSFCTNLVYCRIPEGLSYIPDYCFMNCIALRSFTVEEGVTAIGKSAFFGCSALETLELPSTLTYIGNGAFYKTGIRKLVIPAGVKNVPDIEKAYNLETLIIPEGAETVGSLVYCTSLKSLELPDSVVSLGNMSYCTSLESITFGKGIRAAGRFSACESLKEIIIPEGAEGFGATGFVYGGAFRDCSSLTRVYLPDSFVIDDDTDELFAHCTSLTEVHLPSGLTKIGRGMFAGTSSLRTLTIPDGVTEIGAAAFSKSGLRELTLPAGVTSIGKEAFYKTMIRELTLPAEVSVIGDYTFEQCGSLERLTVKGQLSSIGVNAFKACEKLTAIDLTGVTSIGEKAFDGCTALKQITLSDGLESIGSRTFAKCTGLSCITVPESVESIADDAFADSYPIICCKSGSYAAGWAAGHDMIVWLLDTDDFAEDGRLEIDCSVCEDDDGNFVRRLNLVTGMTYSVPVICEPVLPGITPVWSSLDETVARFDSEGRLVTLSEGSTRIRVEAGGRTCEAELFVSSFSENFRFASMSADAYNGDTLTAGLSYKLSITCSHDIKGFEGSYSVTSGDENILTCENGGLTAHAPGKAMVTLTLNGLSFEQEFTVLGADDFDLILKNGSDGAELSGSVDVEMLGTLTAYAYVSPFLPDEYLYPVVYESSDPAVASVSRNSRGYLVVTGNSFGTASITARIGESNTASFTVNIVETEHSYVGVLRREPTCTEDGYEAGMVCEKCGDGLVAIPRTGHSFITEGPVGDSCTGGWELFESCIRCGIVSENSVRITKQGHSLTYIEAREVSCTEDGYPEHWMCGVCGEYFLSETAVSAAAYKNFAKAAYGHNPRTVWAQDATCTTDGFSTYIYCLICGEYILEPEIFPAAGHDILSADVVEPTCAEWGHTGPGYCRKCRAYCKDGKDLPPVRVHHIFGDTCSVCGETFSADGSDVIRLPENTLRIESEAFAGIAAHTVVIPVTCGYIGSGAFASCADLYCAFVPEGADVAADAFDADTHVCLYTVATD